MAATALLPAGCLTARQRAKEAEEFPRNRVFEPGSVSEMPAGKDFLFAEFDRGGTQSVCLLMLAPGAELKKRYHADHDMTMFVVSGEAIVAVEETRYTVKPGSAVLLPRLTAYTVLVSPKTDKGFTALVVFSPPFDEKDTVLED